MGELDMQNGRVNFIHTFLETKYLVHVFDLLPHVAQLAYAIVEFRIVGYDCTGIAQRPEGLGRIEGVAADITK